MIEKVKDLGFYTVDILIILYFMTKFPIYRELVPILYILFVIFCGISVKHIIKTNKNKNNAYIEYKSDLIAITVSRFIKYSPILIVSFRLLENTIAQILLALFIVLNGITLYVSGGEKYLNNEIEDMLKRKLDAYQRNSSTTTKTKKPESEKIFSFKEFKSMLYDENIRTGKNYTAKPKPKRKKRSNKEVVERES